MELERVEVALERMEMALEHAEVEFSHRKWNFLAGSGIFRLEMEFSR